MNIEIIENGKNSTRNKKKKKKKYRFLFIFSSSRRTSLVAK